MNMRTHTGPGSQFVPTLTVAVLSQVHTVLFCARGKAALLACIAMAVAAVCGAPKSLQDLLQEECDQYDPSKNKSGDHRCHLCPFRCFSLRSRRKKHKTVYHHAPYFTAAASSAKSKPASQYRVAEAMYREDVARLAITGEFKPRSYLKESSKAIREWNKELSQEEKVLLGKSNQVPLVFSWDRGGPRYMMRSQTRGYMRLTDKIYCTEAFEDLLVGTLLQCQGKFQATMNRLHARWAESTDGMPLLFTKENTYWPDAVKQICENPEGILQRTLLKLKQRAAARGEWTVIKHDATFKILFSILGQEKMSQAIGEAHTAHTFVGTTGACPGFALEAKEGPESFGRALKALFTPQMIALMRFLFSDCPHEDMLDYLPEGLGAAEDFLHFTLRLEKCCGEKRIACTREVLSLQQKFRVGAAGESSELLNMIYHGEEGVSADWYATPAATELSAEDWVEYLKAPWVLHTSNEEYVAQLKRVSLKYIADMHKTDQRGKDKTRTMLQILKAGATYRHYRYLFNGSVFVSIAGGSAINDGTTVNESKHRTLKRWTSCVVSQHVDRVEYIGNVWGLYDMLSNSYRGIVADQGTKRNWPDVTMLCGFIVSGGLRGDAPHVVGVAPVAPQNRKDLRTPHVDVDAGSRQAKKQVKVAHSAAWKKHMQQQSVAKSSRVIAKPRMRLKKKGPEQAAHVYRQKAKKPRLDSVAITEAVAKVVATQ
jgi:hypothetical protein